MSMIASMLSSIVVVLNSIGLEMYSKLCSNPSEGGDANLNVNGTMTTPQDSFWVGQCGINF
jgi:hypothetical protein